jgi:nucleotide-binding universal stress UspA family protein
MYKVIMGPTDGSDSERAAISAAVRLAQRFDAELHLVRVEPAPLVIETKARTPKLITERELLDERRASLHKLEALATECSALGDIKVATALDDGPVAPTLRDYAREFNVDLIVMASHSRGGAKRITLGSVTDYLIRRTNTPVLVMRPSATPLGGTPEQAFNRIVVPLDGSAMAEQILAEVVALASGLNSTVSLLQVLTPLTSSQNEIMQAGLPWWDTDIVIADAYLTRAASYLTERGLTVNKDVVLSDDVATAILDYSSRARADLIALTLTTSGSGGLGRPVFGAVADEVTRKSTSSLLVLHAKGPGAIVSVGAGSYAETVTVA